MHVALDTERLELVERSQLVWEGSEAVVEEEELFEVCTHPQLGG